MVCESLEALWTASKESAKKQLRKADSTVNRLKLPIHRLVPNLEPFWGAKKVKLPEDQKKGAV